MTPTPIQTATPLDSPTPTPDDTPTAGATPTETESAREAELEELRATNRFLELAEADRARNATWARFGYHQFAPHADGEVLFEWANKDELWNSIAPAIRDECLLAGPEATRPMWDAQVVIPAGIEPRWNHVTTGDRGQFVEFVCAYFDESRDEQAELWTGILIATDSRHYGRPTASSEPFVLYESEFDDFDSAGESAKERMWEWIIAQPVVED